MQNIIDQMERGNEIPRKDLQKIAGKLVRFFKKQGFPDVSLDTRKSFVRYFLIRVKGEVSDACFLEASKICPPTKTHVLKPDGVHLQNAYSYFWV